MIKCPVLAHKSAERVVIRVHEIPGLKLYRRRIIQFSEFGRRFAANESADVQAFLPRHMAKTGTYKSRYAGKRQGSFPFSFYCDQTGRGAFNSSGCLFTRTRFRENMFAYCHGLDNRSVFKAVSPPGFSSVFFTLVFQDSRIAVPCRAVRRIRDFPGIYQLDHLSYHRLDLVIDYLSLAFREGVDVLQVIQTVGIINAAVSRPSTGGFMRHHAFGGIPAEFFHRRQSPVNNGPYYR